jgi:enoyl-CoA hydratase/carnithine racemase
VNALSLEVFDALSAMGERLKSETGVRAVILTGAEGNFSSGIDLMSLQSEIASNKAFREHAYDLAEGEVANRFQKPCYVWKELQVPVIAAISGVCFGGGIQVAMGADIRIVAPDARISILEIKWGLTPDMGMMTALSRVMRMDQLKELSWTGREVSGQEAVTLGLATRVADDPMAAARELAATLVKKNPDAIRRSKQMFEAAWNTAPAETLRLEVDAQAEVLGMPNQMEAVFAQLQKRDPNFNDG